MNKKVAILGGGVAGVAAAVRLSREYDVTLVSRSEFVYYADLPRVFFDDINESATMWPLDPLLSKGVNLVRAEVTKIDAANRNITLAGRNAPLAYDELIVALGAEVEPGPHFWSVEGLRRYREQFGKAGGGRLVVCVEGTPYRCPPAPFDIAYRLSSYLVNLGHKPDAVTVLHPEREPLSSIGRHVYQALMNSMTEVGIKVVGGFNVVGVDWEGKTIEADTGEKVGFDTLHLVPKHKPPSCLAGSELSTAKGWADVDTSARSRKYDDVHLIGDISAPTLGLPMAGFLALYEADSVTAALTGGHSKLKPEASCPVEAGGHSIIPLCDFGPKLAGSPLPKCTLGGADSWFMSFFRNLARAKFQSELGLGLF